MNRGEFREYLKNNIMILDGATGTQLQKKGMPRGVCPEQWVVEHPEVIMEVQREYVEAGSTAVYTCTFGGNRIKLEEFGLGDQVFEINKKLAQLSRQAVVDKAFVAGDLAPTGQFIHPIGELSFEEMVGVYKEQVRGLLEGGVDFFIVETMMDIQEARAALLAVKESCDLPVCISMTFNEDGRTLTGTDPTTALITLQSLGADAVGCNCSTGPEQMLDIIAAMSSHAAVPLLAKPNAGLPKLVDGETVFTMNAGEFGTYVKSFIELGVGLIGGCCGTSPSYIEQIQTNISGVKPIIQKNNNISVLASSGKTVYMGGNRPLVVIGERINPTGKKVLQQQLKEGKMEEVLDLAMNQLDQGAEVLDVNVGMPGINEKETMIEVIQSLCTRVHAPLCIDSSSHEVIEAALRIYPGRALINSISAEKEKLERLLPIAAKYGAMFILLPLDDTGIPETAEERYKVIERVYSEAQKYGFEKKDIIVDGLVMTVSADQKAAAETLKVVDWCTNHFGCGTVMGLSNVSFGLPERSWVNGAFLAMAMGKGLTSAIANPSVNLIMNMKKACDVLTSRDANAANYITHFAGGTSERSDEKNKKASVNILEQIYDAVVKGSKDSVSELINTALKQNAAPDKLVNEVLIPAITHVGELYDQKKYFLPQLIQSAEAMKKAFERVEPLLKTQQDTAPKNKTKLVLATVRGDIHDIGKNIVGLMLKNYGFEVHDLGKDVSAQDIIDKAREIDAQIIGLSALMTTTMVEMKEVIQLAKKEGLRSKFMIGGAVVNEQFAQEIGADGYSEDAHSAVKLAQKLS
ncbi:homocysteine S-methyltransferase family protein [Petroclostridium sp. X23]|uniref:homocysteine S-methyltransferase family protein n=1 Tax=Petroclostridium sp. X23 TaxID=3045146 RepID=UPI0024AE69BE|nr:homocysteine S-methyltransferase family protein [Petroclostridium sp. X23]WHH57304.1 homocysteine S-methyltransferase family protein [Petroclostridium sp. X23]